MDDSQSAGRKPKRFFSDEFKRDAVRLIVEEKYTFKAAAEALGVREQSLRQWHAKLAPKPEPCGENATLAWIHEHRDSLPVAAAGRARA